MQVLPPSRRLLPGCQSIDLRVALHTSLPPFLFVQVLLTGAGVAAVAMSIAGLSLPSAIILGGALAMSSTAVGIQVWISVELRGISVHMDWFQGRNDGLVGWDWLPLWGARIPTADRHCQGRVMLSLVPSPAALHLNLSRPSPLCRSWRTAVRWAPGTAGPSSRCCCCRCVCVGGGEEVNRDEGR